MQKTQATASACEPSSPIAANEPKRQRLSPSIPWWKEKKKKNQQNTKTETKKKIYNKKQKDINTSQRPILFLRLSAIPFYENNIWIRKGLENIVVPSWFWIVLWFWLKLYLLYSDEYRMVRFQNSMLRKKKKETCTEFYTKTYRNHSKNYISFSLWNFTLWFQNYYIIWPKLNTFCWKFIPNYINLTITPYDIP